VLRKLENLIFDLKNGFGASKRNLSPDRNGICASSDRCGFDSYLGQDFFFEAPNPFSRLKMDFSNFFQHLPAFSKNFFIRIQPIRIILDIDYGGSAFDRSTFVGMVFVASIFGISIFIKSIFGTSKFGILADYLPIAPPWIRQCW